MKGYGRRMKDGAEGWRVENMGNGDDFSFKIPVISQSCSQSILKSLECDEVFVSICQCDVVSTPSLLNKDLVAV